MTAGFGFAAALVVGLIFGWGFWQRIVIGMVWFVGLAAQTAYLAQPGITSFDGGSGLHTVRWWAYWAGQPVILGAALGLMWAASRLRSTMVRRVQARSA